MNRHSGFTLLELLVAIAIFALVAVMAYGGLNAVIRQSDIVQDATAKLAFQQQGIRQLQQDLTFAVDRPVRDALGGPVPAFVGGGVDLLSLTRLGVANPWGKPRAQLARVFWRLTAGQLQRATLMPVDGTENDSARPLVWQTVLRGVTALQLKFFADTNQAFEVWPPPNQPDAGLPKATEIELTLSHMPALRMTVAQVAAWPVTPPAPVAPPAGGQPPAQAPPPPRAPTPPPALFGGVR